MAGIVILCVGFAIEGEDMNFASTRAWRYAFFKWAVKPGSHEEEIAEVRFV